MRTASGERRMNLQADVRRTDQDELQSTVGNILMVDTAGRIHGYTFSENPRLLILRGAIVNRTKY